MCACGQLNEDNIFDINYVIQPNYAPQRPLISNNNVFKVIILNNLSVEPGNEKSLILLTCYLKSINFDGDIILSNVLNLKDSSKESVLSCLKRLEGLFLHLTRNYKLHIIPGFNDASNLSFPIIPINKNLFSYLKKNDRIYFHSNPENINISGKRYFKNSYVIVFM